MSVNLSAAVDFVTTHARVLDRHRFAILLGEGDPAQVAAGLDAYRNPDGGYGWGLEPDLRGPESQPGAALHAFEAFAEMGSATTPRAVQLCDWLAGISLADGGMPFALPISRPAGTAPWWVNADPSVSSLQISAAAVSTAALAARHDPAVAAHPWYRGAVDYCLREIGALDGPPHAIVLKFAIDVLDAVHDTHPDAAGLLEHLAGFVPADGRVAVEGGTADEAMRPLDFAPLPGRPSRALFARDVVEADLDALMAEQQPDGGWPVVYATASPQAALEWRGILTVRAIAVLRAAGRI